MNCASFYWSFVRSINFHRGDYYYSIRNIWNSPNKCQADFRPSNVGFHKNQTNKIRSRRTTLWFQWTTLFLKSIPKHICTENIPQIIELSKWSENGFPFSNSKAIGGAQTSKLSNSTSGWWLIAHFNLGRAERKYNVISNHRRKNPSVIRPVESWRPSPSRISL